jgi:hypothetical protein
MNARKETTAKTEREESEEIKMTTKERTLAEEEKERWYYSDFGMNLRKVTPTYNDGDKRKYKVYVFFAEDKDGKRYAYTWRLNDDMGLYYPAVAYAKAWAKEEGIDAVKIAAYKADGYADARKTTNEYLSGEISLKESENYKGLYTVDFSGEGEESAEAEESTEEAEETAITATTTEEAPEDIFGNIDLKPIDKENGVYEIDIGDDKPKENPGTRFPKNSREDDKEQDKIAGNPVPENDGLTKEEMKLVREYNGVHRRLESLIRQASRGAFEGEMMDAVNDQRNAMRDYMAALRKRARLMGFDIITKKRE